MQEYKNNYAPEGKILWDSWFINKGDVRHMFHLQADRATTPDPSHGHHVSIGHAVSKDFITWEELPTALKVGKDGEWDDENLWSGCAAE